MTPTAPKTNQDQRADADGLDHEVFICAGCKREFAAIDGTWPRYNSAGEAVITTDHDDMWGQVNFYCYDCAD